MWHPFDLFPDTFAPAAKLGSSTLPDKKFRLTFHEHIIRYFKSQPGKPERRQVIETIPAALIIEQTSPGNITFQRKQTFSLTHTTIGTLTFTPAAHRPPTQWRITQTFTLKDGTPSKIPPTTTSASLNNGTLTATTTSAKNSFTKTHPATQTLSHYALIASFPNELFTLPGTTLVLDENHLIPTNATLTPAAENLQSHPFATQHKLTGRILTHHGNLPTEFWLNSNNIPLLILQGPVRALTLHSIH